MVETIKTILILDPRAKLRLKEASIATRVKDLNGKVIGFLCNGKPNADILLQRIKEQLSKRFNLAGTNWQDITKPGGPADTTIIEELVRTSDLVIVALAD
ncbi:hypothetical protein ACFLWC_05700 [Chloroflexota bacterium]